MSKEKPWKSFPEQLALLQGRGLLVDNEPAASDYLERIGYYRLSGYWYPFRELELTQDDKWHGEPSGFWFARGLAGLEFVGAEMKTDTYTEVQRCRAYCREV